MKLMQPTLLRCAFAAVLSFAATSIYAEETMFFYAGTYTGKESKGIYLLSLEPQTAKLKLLSLAAEAANPGFIAISPDATRLYSVEESKSPAGSSGAVAAFEINPSDKSLKLLNRLGGVGSNPCHLELDKDASHLAVSAYGNGVLSIVKLKQPDGSLDSVSSSVKHQGSSVNLKRQAGPHAHGNFFDATGRLLLVCDLGLDKVMAYSYDSSTGSIAPAPSPFAVVVPGAGPRHLCFHPNGDFIYVVNEMIPSLTVFAFDKANSSFRELQTLSLLPDGTPIGSNSGAEVQMHPSGNFLYASLRGENFIAVYKVASDGKLEFVSRHSTLGKTPRHFEIAPGGEFLLAANQDSGNIALFRIDPKSGSLAVADEIKVPSPVCIKFLPK